MRTIFAACAFISVFLVPAGADCLKANQEGQVAEGKLERRRISVEAYKLTETAYLLFPSKSLCLDGEDYDHIESAKRTHVFSMDRVVRTKLEASLGKKVRVTGNAFGEQTVHHHAPIMMNVVAVELIR